MVNFHVFDAAGIQANQQGAVYTIMSVSAMAN